MLNLGVELVYFSGAYAPNRHKFRLGASLLLFLIWHTTIASRCMICLKYKRGIPI